MSLEAVGDAGVVGVVALFILKEVFSFVKSYKKEKGDTSECDDATEKLASLETKLASLVTSSQSMAAVMEKCDASGLPLVYRDGSLTDAIRTLNASISSLATKVERI